MRQNDCFLVGKMVALKLKRKMETGHIFSEMIVAGLFTIIE